MRATLQAIKANLRKRMHRPPGEQARWLRSVVQVWLNCHAVPGNSKRIGRQRWTWDRMQRLARKPLPRARIIHPNPKKRYRSRLKGGAV